ncbi:MAG TPA: molybdenum cofactor guanylyltransferase [Syntrophorhabdaceae bacterium]|nr:molybdenum cofactor guanylyltransferase [Syntrophorhabdaceae bacterium]HPU30248.1 molybdenum cofactor guanylyltransferase [Syntrophorhabdaceae bacterium]
MDISCAILAGGASSRMGIDKATMVINGKSLIEHVYDSVKGIFEEIMVISNNTDILNNKKVKVYKDIVPVKSTLTGIVTGLIHSRNPYVFIVACDMPNISDKGIRYILENIRGEDIVIPKVEKGYEPLHAVYKRTCIPYILNLIEKRNFKISNLFSFLSVKILEDNPFFIKDGQSIFININTQEDLLFIKRND